MFDPVTAMAPAGPTEMKRPETKLEAAKQIETVFARTLLKEVRKAMPDSLFGSSEMQGFQDMFDGVLAERIELGLAEQLAESLPDEGFTTSQDDLKSSSNRSDVSTTPVLAPRPGRSP